MKQLALDNLLQRIFVPVGFVRGGHEQWQSTPQECQRWQRVYELLQRLAPQPQAVRTSSLSWPHVWLPVQRESWAEVKAWYTQDEQDKIDDADEIDSERDSFEELQENWQLEYPYETDWFRAACEVFDGTLSCALLPKEYCVLLKLDQHMVSGLRDFQDEKVRQGFAEYTNWLTTALEEQLKRLLEDPNAYHAALEQRLPKRERFGKLRRRDFWYIAPDAEHFLRDELASDEVTTFSTMADQLTAETPLTDLTLNDFLRFCTICYEGAGYDLAGLTPREQYLAKADGRHDGLLDIEPDSPQALADWFAAGHRGGHPWEIVRGGNTTHISLFLSHNEGGYTLFLAGSARSRATETIRMALALWRHTIPFGLHQAEHLKRMATGEDWIGMVPHHFGLAPQYCEAFFPKEDQIYDFISFLSLAEYPGLEQRVEWYPLERVRLS